MDSNDTCLAVISLESALKKDENYKCKYIKKVIRHIVDELESSSDYFSEE